MHCAGRDHALFGQTVIQIKRCGNKAARADDSRDDADSDRNRDEPRKPHGKRAGLSAKPVLDRH